MWIIKTKSEGVDFRAVKEDAIYFENLEKEEMLIEQEYEAFFTIVSLTFDPKKKCFLCDGNANISALVKDEVFLKKIENREISFRDGDMLHCLIHTKQLNTKAGLKNEYEVIKVLEHLPATTQLDLFEEE